MRSCLQPHKTQRPKVEKKILSEARSREPSKETNTSKFINMNLHQKSIQIGNMFPNAEKNNTKERGGKKKKKPLPIFFTHFLVFSPFLATIRFSCSLIMKIQEVLSGLDSLKLLFFLPCINFTYLQAAGRTCFSPAEVERSIYQPILTFSP